MAVGPCSAFLAAGCAGNEAGVLNDQQHIHSIVKACLLQMHGRIP